MRRLLAVLLAFALVVLACGGDDGTWTEAGRNCGHGTVPSDLECARVDSSGEVTPNPDATEVDGCIAHPDEVLTDQELEDFAVFEDFEPLPLDFEGGEEPVQFADLGLFLYRWTQADPTLDGLIGRVNDMRAQGIVASPHYFVQVVPKWKFGPYDVAVPWERNGFGDTALFNGSGKVIVLDTGWLDGFTGEVDNLESAEEELYQSGPFHGHGTFIAGIIHDAAPKVSIDVRAIAFSGERISDEASVIAALNRANAFKTSGSVINMSFGTYACQEDLEPLGLDRAIATLNHVVVAAAGNDALADPFYPAAYADYSVGAASFVDGEGWEPAQWSNPAPHYAPGENVISFYASSSTRYARWSGSSFAAPHFAACLAGGGCQSSN